MSNRNPLHTNNIRATKNARHESPENSNKEHNTWVPFQQFQPSSVARFLEDGPDQERNFLVETTSKNVSNTFSFSTTEFRVLKKFIAGSKELAKICITRAEVHSLLSINDLSLVNGRFIATPIYSKNF